MAALREVLAAASGYNSYPYNHGNSISWSLSDDEISGNLGWVAANATLAERFGYDPHNDIADTPENRLHLNLSGFGDNIAGDWLRAAWLIPEDLGFLDRNKPEQRVTAEQAWKAYTHFNNQRDPDGYAQKLLSSHDIAKDSEWARQAMLLRLKPGKQPTELDRIITTQYLFRLP